MQVILWALAGLLLWPVAVQAQPLGKTLVIPVGVPDAKPAFGAADSLESKLTERRVTVIPLHDARDRFTAHSRPPLMASDSDLDVLAREARQAIEHVAFGRTVAAQRSVREVITRAERTLESLNRETARARQLLDACLALVRSQLHDGRRQEALEQAASCRRLVPDLAPSEAAHPPNVIGVLAEADDLMRRMRTGRLTVTSVPEQTCSVFLNGRHLGTTPFVLDRASSGEYRVQVECGPSLPGRVHVVQLGDQPVSITVDSSFDAAAGSEPRLSLSYPAADVMRASATQHAAQLGHDTYAEDVMLVRVEGNTAELMRVRTRAARLIARAQVNLSLAGAPLTAAWDQALTTLAEGRLEGAPSLLAQSPPKKAAPATVGPTVLEEAGPAPAAPVQKPAADRRPQRLRHTGYALSGLAGALFVTGLALDLRSHTLQDELVAAGFEVDLTDQNAKYDAVSGTSWLGLAAGPVGVAAAALLVRPQSEVPWWSYAVGGLGVGLVGVGVYELASKNSCELGASEGGCLIQRNSGRRGGLLLSAALPLLSVPLLHWLRRDVAKGVEVDVSSEYLSHGALLRVHARY